MTKLKLGQYAEARPLLQAAYDLFTKEFGTSNPVSAEAGFGLAVCDAWMQHENVSEEQKDAIFGRAREGLAQMMGSLEADHLLVQQAAKEQEKLIKLMVKGDKNASKQPAS